MSEQTDLPSPNIANAISQPDHATLPTYQPAADPNTIGQSAPVLLDTTSEPPAPAEPDQSVLAKPAFLTPDSITDTTTAIQALESVADSTDYFSPVAIRALAVLNLDDLQKFDACRESARAAGIKGQRLAQLESAVKADAKALKKARADQAQEQERKARAVQEALQEEALQERLAAEKAEKELAEEAALAEELAVKPSQLDQGMAHENEIERPSYVVHEEWTDFGKPGVYYHGMTAGSEKKPPVAIDQYICDPLYIDAGSCDLNQNNFGLMLRFRNRRGKWRKWLMPLEMLKGSCEDLRGQLLSQGLSINPHARNQLPTYLQAKPPEKNIESALRVGWYDDCFILPNQVIGNRDDIYFQTSHAVSADYGQRGTLEDWQVNISRYCIGNPL